MRSLPAWLRRSPLVASLLLPVGVSGCIGSQRPSVTTAPHSESSFTPVEVPDEVFGSQLHRVLRDGGTAPDRGPLLAGVVRRQLAHAARRFETGHSDRATEAVMGALYLVRAGEGRGEMIDAAGEKALAGAIARVSQRGDEGRSEALLRVRAAALPPNSPARREVDEHLEALRRWTSDTHTGVPLRRLGADERAAVSRALVDTSAAAQNAAVAAVAAWIAGALEFLRTPRPDMDDASEAAQALQASQAAQAGEALRALEWGGATLVSLFLRNGDARGALAALERTGAREVTHPAFYAYLQGAAVNDDARDYQALAAYFEQPRPAFVQRDQDPRHGKTPIEAHVASAALWGSTLEAYRRQPSDFDTSHLLGRLLIRFGMHEATAPVIADALGARPTAASASHALELILAAMGDSAASDDFEAARRTFKEAAPVLALAESPDLRGQIEPSPSRIRFVMAGIELRAGHLAASRPLLQEAAAGKPSVGTYMTLAMVERQAGDTDAALANLQRAVTAPDARSALLDVADANLLSFEIFRDTGKPAQAKVALDAALSSALASRQLRGGAAVHARAERILGRVLSSYGDGKGAARAFDRALAAAASDRPALGAAMLDAIGRALVRRDLAAARAALKRGIEGDVNDDDLVYGGLWVTLMAREQHVTPDASVERALRPNPRNPWAGKLTAWAAGKLSDTELSTAAQSSAQRVEAAFYAAMARRVAGDPSAPSLLAAVAKSPVIDLLEVNLARDLGAPAVPAALPAGVQIP